jgi:hypothetical protein
VGTEAENEMVVAAPIDAELEQVRRPRSARTAIT